MGPNGLAVGIEEAGDPRASRVYAPTTQRERLLDGMAQMVARRGYVATSVADVLRAAGISRRTFYEQFLDKQDCFLSAYDEFDALCSERVAAAYAAERDWRAGIASALDTLLALLAAEPDFARLAVVEVVAAGPPGLARRDTTLRRITGFVERRSAHLEGALAPPELAAQVIAGGLHELVHARIVRGDARQLPALHEELLRSILLLIGIQPARG